MGVCDGVGEGDAAMTQPSTTADPGWSVATKKLSLVEL